MAVENTTKQMALTRDTGPGGFMERIVAMMSKAAGVILGEPGSTSYHAGRAVYARSVVQNPNIMSTTAASQIVMAPAVIASTTYDEATKTSVCTITDSDLQNTIKGMWNDLAGIDQSS